MRCAHRQHFQILHDDLPQVAILFIRSDFKPCFNALRPYNELAEQLNNAPNVFPLAVANIDLNPSLAVANKAHKNFFISLFQDGFVYDFDTEKFFTQLQKYVQEKRDAVILPRRRASDVRRQQLVQKEFNAAKAGSDYEDGSTNTRPFIRHDTPNPNAKAVRNVSNAAYLSM